MKTLDLIGYKRQDFGKKYSKRLRAEANVPCVLYGGKENVHFYTPMVLFKDLIYTPEVCFVNMDMEGTEYKCILQDVQFHPVSETILHADFLFLQYDKAIKMDIPVKFVGSAPGLLKGGKLTPKLRKIKVKGLPQNLPDNIEVSIEGLELGQSVRVSSINAEKFEILNSSLITVGSIAIPRALRSTSTAEDTTEEEEVAE